MGSKTRCTVAARSVFCIGTSALTGLTHLLGTFKIIVWVHYALCIGYIMVKLYECNPTVHTLWILPRQFFRHCFGLQISTSFHISWNLDCKILMSEERNKSVNKCRRSVNKCRRVNVGLLCVKWNLSNFILCYWDIPCDAHQMNTTSKLDVTYFIIDSNFLTWCPLNLSRIAPSNLSATCKYLTISC